MRSDSNNTQSEEIVEVTGSDLAGRSRIAEGFQIETWPHHAQAPARMRDSWANSDAQHKVVHSSHKLVTSTIVHLHTLTG